MPPLTKILLPVDFSERCLGAARYAGALASHFGAEVILAHVVEPVRYEFSSLELCGTVLADLAANRAAQAKRQLDAFLAEELRSLPTRRVLLEGDPAQKIVACAHAEQAGLIALPTHGYGPFRRFILGSVTAKVLHDADCPVLTGVHLEEAPAAASIAFRTILCAVDLGPQSRQALQWAAQLAADFKARLLLVHAYPCLEARPGEHFDREVNAGLARTASQELEKLQQEEGVEAESLVLCGDPPKVVCQCARQRLADLLVIGRGSAAGIFGRLRTNAYAIIRESPCPVVSV
ncbi:MAG: universal stress protein [Acidobacteriota bacterium]